MRIIKVNKRYVGVMLGKLCGRGNLTFTNLCMDSSFVLFWCFFFFFLCITTWLKRLRVWICSTRYIKSEKRLIRSILIQLVLQRRIGWKGLVWHQRDLGRDGLNSRMSSSLTWRELMQENLSRTKKKGPLLHCILFLYVMLCYYYY